LLRELAPLNPGIVVDAAYLGPYHDGRHAFLDVEQARETASDMYQNGVDVIHHSAGDAAEGIVTAAAELHNELGDLWVIGSEIDEIRDEPADRREYFLTSMWKRRDRAVYEAIRAYLAGDLEPGVHRFGLADGSVDFSRESALSVSQVETLEHMRDEIISGSIVPPSAPPRWTRQPAATATLVFDGEACRSADDSFAVSAGDVICVGLVNNSTLDVGVTFSKPDEGSDADDTRPFVTTFATPGHRSALAMRVESGTFSAHCLTSGVIDEEVIFVSRFETICEGPEPASDDPSDILRALSEAMNRRDAGAVCSLFAGDAVVPE